MPKLKQSASDKAQFSAYPTRFSKNKIAKMQRTLRAQPNNSQLEKDLVRVERNGAVYTRNRKSNGHKCKGMNNSLGFENNLPSEGMKKSKLETHWYYGAVVRNLPSAPYAKFSLFKGLGFNVVRSGRINARKQNKSNTPASR